MPRPRHLIAFLAILAIALSHSVTSAGSKKDKKKEQSNAPSTPALSRGKGTPWTILCLEVQGSHRYGTVAKVADVLKNTSEIREKDVRVVAEPDGFIRLYYGTYYRKTDPKTGKRDMPKDLRKDLDLIKQLGVGPEQYAFKTARMVPMPVPDVGNPQWVLTRAKGIYTLQVAVFEPTDDFWDFKSAAAEYCEFLRKEGYEAYYHHGPSTSVVSVGAFGPDAVITPPRGVPYYSNEINSLQEDELLKYNLVNGAIVKTKSAQIHFGRAPELSVNLKSNDHGSGVPMLSRLVHIPGHELSSP